MTILVDYKIETSTGLKFLVFKTIYFIYKIVRNLFINLISSQREQYA